MRKASIILSLLLAVGWALPVQAHDFSARLKGGQTLYFNITDTVRHTVELTYEGKIQDAHENQPAGRLEIPRTVKYKGDIYTVTAIGPKTFSGAALLEAVVIPETVETIQAFAFEDCVKLSAILFPGSPVAIGEGVFFRCSAIENISFGSDWKEINLSHFRWSEKLRKIQIPARVEKLSNLKKLASLESVEVDSNNSVFTAAGGMLLSKDGTILYACPRSRRGDVTVPEGVKTVKEGAFIDCLYLENVVFPASLEDLSYEELSRSGELKSVTFLSEQPLLNYSLNEEPRFALKVASPQVKVYVPASAVAAWRSAVQDGEGFLTKKSIRKIK